MKRVEWVETRKKKLINEERKKKERERRGNEKERKRKREGMICYPEIETQKS